MTLRYGSVCSGIEAATVAWHPLGWQPQFFSEIDAAPRAVLAHRYPEVPLHGDFTTIREGQYGAIDLLVGGTPCQSFSVAGLRGGLADDRGNLALEYLRLAQRLRPRWLVWENVPGVLSSNGGWDFGAILGGLVELGYGFAYRVLDAQYVRVDGFGRAVPQRRRRVFVVGCLGDWRRAAAVLLERACLRGDPAPRREAGARVAGSLTASLGGGSGGGPRGPDDNSAQSGHLIAKPVAAALDASFGRLQGASNQDAQHGFSHLVAFDDAAHRAFSTSGAGFWREGIGALRAREQDSHENLIAFDTTQITSRENRANPEPGGPCHPFAAGAHLPAIAFSCKDHGADATDEGIAPTLRAMGHSGSHANAGGQMAVALPVTSIAEIMYGVSHADAAQAGPDQALRALRDAVGSKAFAEWGAGVVAALRAQEVLRSGVHGEGIRCPADDRHELGNDASSLAKTGVVGPVRALWSAGCHGCPPSGWQPSERLAQELGAYLPLLSRERASAARFLLSLWRASEGLGLLREALSALQEAWRPARCADQSAQVGASSWAVRRLTPIECERLMGFPDDYTAVPWRKGTMPDGLRYKMCGNSMAVNAMRWIGRRIAMVESIPTPDLPLFAAE